jgi:hypothetical protein
MLTRILITILILIPVLNVFAAIMSLAALTGAD